MKKKVLLIINPCSGKMKVNKLLTDIVDVFTKADFLTTILTTTRVGDATKYAQEYAKNFDLIACAGGDGTFNETVSGVIKSKIRVPIGYIPCGSTNDFAQSLGLSKDIVGAARDIVNGYPIPFDVGDFSGRPFSYVASFGAFTSSAYETPQNVKNALGHLAYILDGINALPSIKSTHVKIEANGEIYEDDYIFGTISNSKSIAGILTLDDKFVDMSDGLFEMLLVKMPKDMIELAKIVEILRTQNFEENNGLVTFVNSSEFRIKMSKDENWTLDGEFQQGMDDIVIKNNHVAIDMVMRKKQK